MEDLLDESLRTFDILKPAEEGGFRDDFIKKGSVGQKHCLLNRGREIFRKKVGEDHGEMVPKGFVVRVLMAKRNAKGACESFGREWFVECPREERIERGLSC